MFENFPYTDMHQLNLDWIIKIAKDFLDQYTHLQQLISDGEASLQNLTDEGVRTLITKTDDLETLLNEWYNTHSADIADQLADALQDLNDWYTVHQHYLDDILSDNIDAFDSHAEAKATETIASIPADYSTITGYVTNVAKALAIRENITDGETIHQTGITLHPGIRYFITISPTTSNYFNVVTTKDGQDVTFWGNHLINGGESYTWEIVLDDVAGSVGTWSLYIKNNSNSGDYTYTIYADQYIEKITKLDDRLTHIETDYFEHKGYFFKDYNITDGATLFNTGFAYDISLPVKIKISPSSTNYFNVILMHGSTEIQYFGQKVITGGSSESWDITREYLSGNNISMGLQSRNDAYDTNWRIVIKNASNSGNYNLTIEYDTRDVIDQNTKILNVNSVSQFASFMEVSGAVQYAKQKLSTTDPITIFVKNGHYSEFPIDEFPYAPINIADSKISIIGESRDNTIITLTNSQDHQSRIMHIGGEQTVKNLTMKVLRGSDWETNVHDPYVIHNDDTYNGFTGHYCTTVENCILYNECSQPVGAGLHDKQTQIYRNVVAIFNPNYTSSQGAMYVHGASNAGQVPDGVIIEDCTCISKNLSPALTMPSVEGYTPYTETPVTIRRTILSSNGTEVATDFKQTHLLTPDSKLNSNSAINY